MRRLSVEVLKIKPLHLQEVTLILESKIPVDGESQLNGIKSQVSIDLASIPQEVKVYTYIKESPIIDPDIYYITKKRDEPLLLNSIINRAIRHGFEEASKDLKILNGFKFELEDMGVSEEYTKLYSHGLAMIKVNKEFIGDDIENIEVYDKEENLIKTYVSPRRGKLSDIKIKMD